MDFDADFGDLTDFLVLVMWGGVFSWKGCGWGMGVSGLSWYVT
ncbi:MAG TPA: hypothetical protein VLL52_08575 [Anaerolineae bacterium]|nr:hypothetical protein [Anaerolineae bacterium]